MKNREWENREQFLCVMLLIGRVIFIDITWWPIKDTNQIININIYIKSNESYEYQSYQSYE